MKRSCAVVCFLILMSLAVGTQQLTSQSLPNNLDAYIESVQKEFEVPGIGLAIVKDGKVLLAKGYGIRKLGETAVVDDVVN